MNRRFSFLLFLLFFLCEITIAKSISHGFRGEKHIALTFDECPSTIHGGYDREIVRTLVDSGVPATFFLSGKWIRRHQREVRELATIPQFELANHSYSHSHYTLLSNDSIRMDVQKTERLLTKYVGSSPRLFRPPFGETDKRVDSIIQSMGITPVLFDLASGDSDSTISFKRFLKYIVSNVHNGSIIVMHANGRGWHTAKALPQIIQLLRKKGFVFVTVSELIKNSSQKGLP